jgi:hypothetical protein
LRIQSAMIATGSRSTLIRWALGAFVADAIEHFDDRDGGSMPPMREQADEGLGERAASPRFN